MGDIRCVIRYLRGPEPDGGMVAMVVVVGGGVGLVVGGLVGGLVGGKVGEFIKCLHV